MREELNMFMEVKDDKMTKSKSKSTLNRSKKSSNKSILEAERQYKSKYSNLSKAEDVNYSKNNYNNSKVNKSKNSVTEENNKGD